MRRYSTPLLISLLACGLFAEAAFSQGAAPPPPAAPPAWPAPPAATPGGAPLYDPRQFPALRGEVQLFTLTPRGDIDGIVLKDGTEVKTPPTLSTEIAYAIKPGDRVTIHGLRAAALPLVRAVSITDESSHRTITDSGALAGGPPPPPRPGYGPQPPGAAPPPPLRANETLTAISGRVRMALHGPEGDVSGALLENGTQLRLAPDQADQFAPLLQPRQTLFVQGVSVASSLGTVIEVRELGTARDALRPVGAPPDAARPDAARPGKPGPRDRQAPPAFAPPPPPPAA